MMLLLHLLKAWQSVEQDLKGCICIIVANSYELVSGLSRIQTLPWQLVSYRNDVFPGNPFGDLPLV